MSRQLAAAVEHDRSVVAEAYDLIAEAIGQGRDGVAVTLLAVVREHHLSALDTVKQAGELMQDVNLNLGSVADRLEAVAESL